MKLKLQKLNARGFDHVLLALAFVVVMALGGTYYLLSQSNAATPWNGGLKVNMAGTNLCMENMDNSSVAYTSLILNTCSSSKQAQHFSIKPAGSNFQVVAAASGACLDDPAGKVTTSGHRVYLETWPCKSTDNAQLWHWGGAGNHQLINVASKGCVNDPGAAKAAGSTNTRLIAYACSSNSGNAQWIEVANSGTGSSSGSGSYKTAPSKSTPSSSTTAALQLPIVNAAGYHMCLDDLGGGTGNFNPVDVYQCNGQNAQTWKSVGAGSSGTGTITFGGKCLEVIGNGTASGTKVRIDTCNKSSGQYWKWTAGGVATTFINPHSGKCLDDPAFSSVNGKQLQIYTCNGGANQKWLPVTPATSSKK